MLFHVTATHTTENCPFYHRERMPEIVAADENLEGALESLESLEGLQVASEVEEAVTAAEAEQAIKDVVRDLREEELGTVAVILLDHAWDLVHEIGTPTNLAQERGMSERTFRDTWKRLRGRLAKHPRLRGFLRSA